MEQYIERSWRFHFILILWNHLKNYCCLNWKSLKSKISFLAMFLPRIPLVRKKMQVQNWMPQYFVKAEIYLYKTICCFLYFNTGNLQVKFFFLSQWFVINLFIPDLFFEGIIKIFRYDTTSEKCDPKKSEPQTTLARRRAEKQKLKGNPDSIKGNRK